MPFNQITSLTQIDTYIINLKRRPERLKNVLKEFAYRSEFKVTVVDAIEDSFGARGLWKTICMIIRKVELDRPEYILICEDDHKFTRHYSEKKLRDNIRIAQNLNSDVLLGGASWVGDFAQLDQTLFWVKNFSGLQFTIIFNKFFDQILQADLKGYDAADYKICELSSDIHLLFPFLSTQRSYLYSDVTPLNNKKGRVKQLFDHSSKKLQKIKKITNFYKKKSNVFLRTESLDIDSVTLPTYIINLKKRKDRKAHIVSQFKGKKEFEITFSEGVVHPFGQVGLWESIRKVVKLAIGKKEDVIIICEDDHEFLQHYNNDFLINNILKAHSLGADILLGGISNFQTAVQADKSLYWVDEFYCTQFIVIYKKFFKKIIDASYNDDITVDGMMSALAFNKQVIYPFISIQKDFGYSDISIRESSDVRPPTSFHNTLKRIDLIHHKKNSPQIDDYS